MSQKRPRTDSTTTPWTIFTPDPTITPDVDGDLPPTPPHEPKHSRTHHPSTPAITCFLPPTCAGTAFATHELFESHYVQAHTNRCIECGKNFPTRRFLELHIAEHHDPLQELRRERGEKGYACFVEGCDRFCSTPQKRRRHVIDKHHFPTEYNWGIVQWGIDNHTTLLTRPSKPTTATTTTTTTDPNTPTKPKKLGGKNPSPKQKDVNARKRSVDIKDEIVPGGTEKMDVVKETAGGEKEGGEEKKKVVKEVEMADVVGAMSGLKLVPMSVRFGRRGR